MNGLLRARFQFIPLRQNVEPRHRIGQMRRKPFPRPVTLRFKIPLHAHHCKHRFHCQPYIPLPTPANQHIGRIPRRPVPPSPPAQASAHRIAVTEDERSGPVHWRWRRPGRQSVRTGSRRRTACRRQSSDDWRCLCVVRFARRGARPGWDGAAVLASSTLQKSSALKSVMFTVSGSSYEACLAHSMPDAAGVGNPHSN